MSNYNPWAQHQQQQAPQTPAWGAHTPVVLQTQTPPTWPFNQDLPPTFAPNQGFAPPQQQQQQQPANWAQRPRAYSQPSPYHLVPAPAPPPPPASIAQERLGYRGLSKKYPDLHPILAIDSVNFYWDARRKPSSEIHQATFFRSKDEPALRTQDRELKLYSKQFPWSVSIKPKEGMCVSVLMVWEGLYGVLQEEISDAEWAMLSGDKKVRERVERAWGARTKGKADKKLRRVDWLGGSVNLRGLEKDDTWMRGRYRPNESPGPQDWLVRMCE